MIYFDNAATSLKKPPEVEDAVIKAFCNMGNAGRGGHGPTLDASRMIYAVREKIAELFGISDPARIAFTSNATEALNIAIQGLFQSGDHVITTACEHNSVLRPLYLMEKRGVELSVVPADQKGRILYEQLESCFKCNTRAIVVTHASNLTGNVTDLKRVTEFAKKHKLLCIVDAAQTAGILPLDVEKSGIDVLCFSGHKGLLGPQGTGGIYVRENVEIPPFKVGGSGVKSYSKEQPPSMPELLEAGTLNGHGIAGLGAALDYLKQYGTEKMYQKEMKLEKYFIEGICSIKNLQLYGDLKTDNRIATVALNIGGYDSAAVSDWLWEKYEIAVRAGAHCAPLMHEALGTKEQGAVRFSFSHYNTFEEVDTAIRAIHEIAE